MSEPNQQERLEELEKNWVFHQQMQTFDDVEDLRNATREAVTLLRLVYSELLEIKESLKTEQLPSCEFDQ